MLTLYRVNVILKNQGKGEFFFLKTSEADAFMNYLHTQMYDYTFVVEYTVDYVQAFSLLRDQEQNYSK